MTEHRPLNTSHERLKLRTEDYLLLDQAGAFADYSKTELIEGTVYYMNARHRPHARIKSRLFFALKSALLGLDNGIDALVEASVSLPPHAIPEPDIILTSAPEGDGLVPLDSVMLIVEVADATLKFDRSTKLALYAEHGIPDYWVVDVEARQIHQMWAPLDGAYTRQRAIAFGTPISAATIAALDVTTGGL